ncbi:hypothetical protein A3A75_03060 [Candidatus Woesebacteria bacterium RIFCSPLOWO2_01_FULL_39_10]|uniref:Uncharacterized protein n=1 Tax=Candidatus Woesebacteria bacterium RIFCSPLOWO2_01_FULL_39_10 TaxID=1802516 RepID=A0A1F8B569_9BACT|nr:MAG: hypothetical protein A3A75_03060 [Candidatus Woesebacteria bacterium RIFCSPLOWO2_01_FULL_39_10]
MGRADHLMLFLLTDLQTMSKFMIVLVIYPQFVLLDKPQILVRIQHQVAYLIIQAAKSGLESYLTSLSEIEHKFWMEVLFL